MRPPAETLDWNTIMAHTFVSDFDLLRQSYGDTEILEKPWMAPANRTVCNKVFKLLRAEEEIDRLHVEIRRLRTWIIVEEKAYKDAIKKIWGSGTPSFAKELERRFARRKAVNDNHHRTLNAIAHLKGFTGDTGAGIPVDWTDEMAASLRDLEVPDNTEVEGDLAAQELEREACREDAERLAAQIELLSIA